MEIAPVPHRSTRSEWRRVALGSAVLAPVVLLVIVPAVLGLDRYVVTDRAMDGALGRGSVVLARQVPPTDLHVGDVISFRAPGTASEERLTRRIVSIHDGTALTEGASRGQDQVMVPLTSASYDRAWMAVPWVGYPFLVDGGWLLLAAAALAAFVLSMAAGRRAPPRLARPEGVRLPVA